MPERVMNIHDTKVSKKYDIFFARRSFLWFLKLRALSRWPFWERLTLMCKRCRTCEGVGDVGELFVRTSAPVRPGECVAGRGAGEPWMVRFVHCFTQKKCSERLFRSFNIEKINRQTDCRQVVVLPASVIFFAQTQWDYATICVCLYHERHDIAVLKHANYHSRAMTLAKTNAKHRRGTMRDVDKELMVMALSIPLIFSVFSLKSMFVRK